VTKGIYDYSLCMPNVNAHINILIIMTSQCDVTNEITLSDIQ